MNRADYFLVTVHVKAWNMLKDKCKGGKATDFLSLSKSTDSPNKTKYSSEN